MPSRPLIAIEPAKELDPIASPLRTGVDSGLPTVELARSTSLLGPKMS